MWAFTAWDINGEDYLASREAAIEDGSYRNCRGRTRRRRNNNTSGGFDPDYYHSWYTVSRIVETHATSYIVEYIAGLSLKIPKKIVRGVRYNKYGQTEMLIHSDTLKTLLISAKDAMAMLPELD